MPKHVASVANALARAMGEGVLETRFGGYQPIGDNPPRRPRTAPSPLDRDAWLASLAKRG